MTASTAQPSAQPAEPVFLLSGTASECLAQLSQRFPRLLSAAVLASLPAKLPATKPYDFWRERPLSIVLDRLCSDLKLPALVRVAQQWSKMRALSQAAVMTAADWCEVLAGRAQLSSPARFARHGHALEGWASPWIADERAAYWGPARCYLCALSASLGSLFFFPHYDACVSQCSGADGRCGSTTCGGDCIGCVRADPNCWGACGAGGPCEAFADGEPQSGGPCVEGEGEQDVDDDRQDEQDEHALIKPPAQPTKPKPTAQAAPSPELPPAAPAALPVAPSLPQPAPQPAPKPIAPSLPTMLSVEQPAKRLASPPTVKPARKPLDVGAALAALRK